LATSQNPQNKNKNGGVIMFVFGQFSDVAKVAIIHKKINTRGVKCGGPLLYTLFSAVST
jgi:hypothetical protein